MPTKIGVLVSIELDLIGGVPACPVLADAASGAWRLFGMRSGRRWGWRPALFYGLGVRASGATAYHPHLHARAAREAAVETYKGPKPPHTTTHQDLPGTESEMDPRPDY